MTTPKNVLLQSVTATDLDLFENNGRSEEQTGTHQWFGFTSLNSVRRRFAENGLLDSDGGVLSVVADDTTVGRVEWFKGAWGRSETSWCWTIAIAVYLEHRGNGIGTEAQRQLTEYLFRHTRAERIQAYTDVENIGEQRALEKAGFTKEGTLRSAQWRDGGWHDQVLFSVVRPSS
ncbi:MAG: GNAT family N-acetyltransferase [Candidatus Eremiobacteraeota bacterium]|nr:GNAT family N-acetyltransferase [Candidatus Eremiobacteraeota bacterium]